MRSRGVTTRRRRRSGPSRARSRRAPRTPNRPGARRRARAGSEPRRASPPTALDPARLPPEVLEALRILGRAGHRSWVVGGTVRDLLVGRAGGGAADVATPATPQQVTSLFRRVVPTGVEHGTVTVLAGEAKIEVTTFRGEGRYIDGRRPSSVTFHADLEGDLARRDFTMNALAWDPLAGELRDPFHGRADIRRRLIRAVGDAAARFAEDGLRPMRALRFVAQLGYAVERRTMAAIPAAAPVVRLVSAERLADELSKLLAGPHAGRALRLLPATGLAAVVLPPLGSLPREAVAHAVAVAASAVDRPLEAGASAPRPDLLVLRLAALLHAVPPAEAARAVAGLRLPGRVAAEVSALLAERPCLSAGAPPALPETPEAVRRWLAAVTPARAPALLALWEADARHLGRGARAASAALRRLRSRAGRTLRERSPLATTDLAIDGRAVMDLLGLAPGPRVGEALRHLLDRVLEDPRRNERGALQESLRAWWSEGGGQPRQGA